MSKEGVLAFIERALNDVNFQVVLKKDPSVALSQFDLSEEEIAAITTGSSEELQAMGLDPRLTK